MGLKDLLEGVLGNVQEAHQRQPDRFDLPLPLPRGGTSKRQAKRPDDTPVPQSGPVVEWDAELEKQKAERKRTRTPLDGHDLHDGHVFHSVVQIVALKKGMFGGMSSAWTGSGTIVHSSGLILTNCHVANPRAMGMSAPEADGLGIAITDHSDEPPALTYYAEVVAQDPQLDLAVIRIVADINGRRLQKAVNLPAVPLGDADQLNLGERVQIYGYPGIGGETVTYTAGNISGFSGEDGVRARRAWIKTDATIAGGNSGGMALDGSGRLIGVPTQAAAGSGVHPVDARPVLDTNRDGRIDQRDTPMAVGGFINGLRPVNLAFPLLEKAGMKVHVAKPGQVEADDPNPWWGQAEAPFPEEERFANLLFSTRVTSDGRPIHPTTFVDQGEDTLYATFEYSGMRMGTPWSVVWMKNGEEIISQKKEWDEPAEGRKTVKISNRRDLPEGEYHLVVGLGREIALEGKVRVGHPVDDSDSEVSGTLIDQSTGRPISRGVFIVLKPGVRAAGFLRNQSRGDVLTQGASGSDGRFVLDQQIRRGQAYSVVVGADGYEPAVIEGALRLSPGAPEKADIGEIQLQRR